MVGNKNDLHIKIHSCVSNFQIMSERSDRVDDNYQEQESEWKPPTEAEQKALQDKRKRSDKISKLMSHYLLKGHKMLATTCPVCSTIELQDKQGRKHCIGCSEVDNVPKSATENGDKKLAVSEPESKNPDSPIGKVAVTDSMEVVLQKLRKATQALAVTDSVELSRDYVVLIKECADAIIALRKAES